MKKICRINAETKKCPERIVFHFSFLNRWIDIRAIHRTYQSSELQILDFKKCCRVFDKSWVPKKVVVSDRTQGNAEEIELKIERTSQFKLNWKVNLPTFAPVHNVVYDKYKHCPKLNYDLEQMWKLEGCSDRSCVECAKSMVFLCLNENSNCIIFYLVLH